jgi:hypothetical protein
LNLPPPPASAPRRAGTAGVRAGAACVGP